MKKIDKQGFTLIELLAVIVILGILVLIAIPSVTKYIDKSKKETYIDNAYSYIDAVRKDVIAGNLQTPNTSQVLIVRLSSIDLEKGSNKSPYGDYIDNQSYVMVKNIDNNLEYYIAARDDKNYEIPLTSETALTTNSVSKTETSTIEPTTSYGIQTSGIATNLFNGNLTNGFIDLNNGSLAESNNSYPNAQYTDIITLEQGHTYQVTGYSDTIRWRLYNADGTYTKRSAGKLTYTATANEQVRILLVDGYPSDQALESFGIYDITQ